MGERRILVVASQCDQLGTLSFLPNAAEDFYGVMTDSELGGCVPALAGPEGGLLLNPDATTAMDAYRDAFVRASADEATLFLSFIGHAVRTEAGFFLLPKNGDVDAFNPQTFVNLVGIVSENHEHYPNVDGLVLLIDACHSGQGAAKAAREWNWTAGAGPERYDVLTASDDGAAYDGCFTLELTRLLRDGLPGPVPKIGSGEVIGNLEERCKRQKPSLARGGRDTGLHLSRNRAADAPWAGTTAASEIERLTSTFVAPAQLAAVAGAASVGHGLHLIGDAGAGKSALVAGMCRPDLTGGLVPANFLQAVAFIDEATNGDGLANVLKEQLLRSVPDFAQATRRAQAGLSAEERLGLSALELGVVRPLQQIGHGPIRIAIDGVDGSAVGLAGLLAPVLAELAGSTTPLVELIVTGRPGWTIEGARPVPVNRATDADLATYFALRGVAVHRPSALLKRSDGNWLVARLLADLLEGGTELEDIPTGGLGPLYEAHLNVIVDGDEERWREQLAPMLGILAAAGVGPVIPVTLAAAASGLGGVTARDILVRLRSIVTRSQAGDPDEHAGCFHQTLVGWLEGTAPDSRIVDVDVAGSHTQIIAALEAEEAPTNATLRYRRNALYAHLLAVGRVRDAFIALADHTFDLPRDNLAHWQGGEDLLRKRLKPGHPYVLIAQSKVAFWWAEAGDVKESIRLFRKLLPRARKTLGADHQLVLQCRNSIAQGISEMGRKKEALRLLSELLPDAVRVLGTESRGVFTIRNNIAYLVGELGNHSDALSLSESLLRDREKAFGPDDEDVLASRHAVATCIANVGRTEEALELLVQLLPDRKRIIGPHNPYILPTRHNIAMLVADLGRRSEAIGLHQEVLVDSERMLGPDHPSTKLIRGQLNLLAREPDD